MFIAFIRTIILILVAVLFVRQARRSPTRSNKYRAFSLAAGAVGLIALLNMFFLLGIGVEPLILPMMSIAVVLLAISALFLYRAWRGGEMADQIARVREAMESERQQRNKNK
jgi:uncharacterized membrane protein